MPFQKNDKNINRAGRPPGKGNRTTEELRATIQAFLEGNLEQMQELWNQLEPREKLSFIERLLKHILPPPIQDISQFSEEDLAILLKRLESRQKELLN